MIFGRFSRSTLVFYELDPIQGQGRELVRTKLESSNAGYWAFSTDGTRVAIVNTNQQGKQIIILDLGNDVDQIVPVPTEWAVYKLCWANPGDALFATVAAPHYQIVRIGLDGKATVLLDRARDTWLGDVAVSPDGAHLAFNQQTFEANVWLLENF